MESLDVEYEIAKIKAVVHLYANPVPTMGPVREKAARTGRRSPVKDTQRYAKEIGMKLDLQIREPIGHTKEDEEVGKRKIGKKASHGD